MTLYVAPSHVGLTLTSACIELHDGTSLTDAIARRDMLSLRQSVLMSVIDAASTNMGRYSLSEVRIVTTVPVGQLRQEYDVLARQRRELDTQIQATNWQTELAET